MFSTASSNVHSLVTTHPTPVQKTIPLLIFVRKYYDGRELPPAPANRLALTASGMLPTAKRDHAAPR